MPIACTAKAALAPKVALSAAACLCEPMAGNPCLIVLVIIHAGSCKLSGAQKESLKCPVFELIHECRRAKLLAAHPGVTTGESEHLLGLEDCLIGLSPVLERALLQHAGNCKGGRRARYHQAGQAGAAPADEGQYYCWLSGPSKWVIPMSLSFACCRFV